MNVAPTPLGSVILERTDQDHYVTLRRPGQWPERKWFGEADEAKAEAIRIAGQHELPLIRIGGTEPD